MLSFIFRSYLLSFLFLSFLQLSSRSFSRYSSVSSIIFFSTPQHLISTVFLLLSFTLLLILYLAPSCLRTSHTLHSPPPLSSLITSVNCSPSSPYALLPLHHLFSLTCPQYVTFIASNFCSSIIVPLASLSPFPTLSFHFPFFHLSPFALILR